MRRGFFFQDGTATLIVESYRVLRIFSWYMGGAVLFSLLHFSSSCHYIYIQKDEVSEKDTAAGIGNGGRKFGVSH